MRATRTRALEEIDGIIHGEIAPLLVGEDGFAVERCWELARPVTWNILRDRRLGLVASACVDVAAVGRDRQGAGRSRCGSCGAGTGTPSPVITIGGYYAEDADITAEVRAAGRRRSSQA